jgi:hypothetical protein
MARRRTRSSSSTSLPERWNSLRPLLAGAGWTVAIAAMALALGMGVPALRAEAFRSVPETAATVRFMNQPPWMTEAEISPLADLVAEQLSGSVMDRGGLAAARDALASTGWFEEIHQVRRTGGNEVIVEGEWTVPFAVVREGGYDHLVDFQGRLLPRCYRPGTSPRSLIRIEGAVQSRPSTYGTRWPGDDLFAAMAVARLIDQRPWRSQVASIDLGGMNEDGCVRLKTARGCTVKWGRAPGREGTAEVPARQKLDYLGWLHEHYGRIDAGCEDQLDLLTDCVAVR